MDELKKATSLSVINKAIKGISLAAIKLNAQIHATALACMTHAHDFGDATASARLVDALPKSHRRSLLINWFDQFSPIGINKVKDSDLTKGFLRGTAEERKDLWMFEEAKATPFFALPEAEREPDIPTFETIHKNVISMLDRLAKKADDIVDDEGKKKAIAEINLLKAAVAA